eukprot:4796410-Karenia_brevis.AAC.1
MHEQQENFQLGKGPAGIRTGRGTRWKTNWAEDLRETQLGKGSGGNQIGQGTCGIPNGARRCEKPNWAKG